PRVFPSGDRSVMSIGAKETEKLISDHNYKNAMMTGGNWSSMGAAVLPTNGGGAGRVDCITFHPSNPNIIYVGTPAGGLWKTTDGGSTWSTNTDNLPSLGVNAIAIDATNPSVMYIGTGDIESGNTNGIGVLKSIDGGVTWNITGLSWITSQGRTVARVLINPADHNMIFAATTYGVYRSLDAAVTWTRVLTTPNIKDLEFKPGNPSIIYAAAAGGMYRSTDTGATFSYISATGLPAPSSVNRIAMAVTPANPAYLYALYSSASDSGFKGLYLSTDSGVTFTLQADSPNLLGYNADGSDAGGNGWYTLSIAVSPLNENEVIVGGVNIWKSYDAGSSWNCIAHWYGDAGLPYVHADIHDLVFRPDGSEFFPVCDGGVFKTNDDGNSFTDKSSGLTIGEMYRLGNSVTNPNMVIQGWQDNGCNLYSSGTWNREIGGDGMETFIDWSTTDNRYCEYQNGAIQRTTDAGATYSDILNNITEPGQWIVPWMQDPVSSATLYAGYQNVWKSTDMGDNWTPISTFNSTGLTILKVAKSNPSYIYAATESVIYKTINGGASWTVLSYPSTGGNAITALEVNPVNPNMIWITRSGYTADNKVYKSVDGGATWTNLSGDLPNIPVNCVVNQTGTNDGIYVGTDLGVYYIDNDLSSWMPYSNGLPNVIIDELEIQYGVNKLRAASYGRGLWQTTIYNPASNLPFANFVGDTLSGCPGFNVQFSDSTINSPTSWSWRFPGGTPAVSTLQNPVVTYNIPGTYNNVTLVVTNAYGTDSITKLSYIAVSPNPTATITLNKNDTICQGQSVYLTANAGNSYVWYPLLQTTPGLNVVVTGTYSVQVTDVFGCTATSAPVDIYVAPLPPVPTITLSGDTLTSSSTCCNQWYLSGSPIAGATNQTYVMPWFSLSITVRVTDSLTGCYSTSATFVGVDETGTNGITYSVYPNPTKGITNLIFESADQDDIVVELTDVLGKKVYAKKYSSFIGRQETEIDMSEYDKGIYFLSIKNNKGVATKKLVKY
ncbi:MAG: VPS10 domain-containing protein, partial [Bacteroidia bacterium]